MFDRRFRSPRQVHASYSVFENLALLDAASPANHANADAAGAVDPASPQDKTVPFLAQNAELAVPLYLTIFGSPFAASEDMNAVLCLRAVDFLASNVALP